MKTLIGLFLAVIATSAMAAGNEQIPATQYNPAQPPDIAEVISVTPTAGACEVVPATMIYVDHQGETHRLVYKVMGGCSGNV
ncbi:DUF2790 domain-containing protein [Pseudomonas sp. UMAB-08]|jgi:hypothetical protein|uniref:DUF2790 domain-containing protein n=1 Tax=Pseudomonas sp. UMAB-08 TaxID=1365375 RepID=UPI001C55BC38|nr:DUF2790 domain-containing protein [Pseudomonas sp. UMAB-08]